MIFDVAIVGAGVIGGMLARELSKYKLSVCILEKNNDVAMGQSRGNSGIVHGGYDPIPGTLKAKLNSEGVELLFQAAKELSVPYKRNGSMVCAFSSKEESIIDDLFERGQQNHISGLKVLFGYQARAIEPNLSPAVTKVLYIPNAGIVCPYDLTIAAVGNAIDNGAILLRNFQVSCISRKNNIFTVVSAKGQHVQCRFLVNCAGVLSDSVARMAGDDFFTIIPRAGEYMLLDKVEGSRVSHTLFQCPTAEGKGVLVTPTVDGNLLVGPTAKEVESPFSNETTAAGLAEVERLAEKSVPSVNFHQVITSFSGVRASTRNGEFILKASDTVAGLIHAGGIDSPGLTCCVSIAKYLIDILNEQGLSLQKKEKWKGYREDPHAFRKMSDEEKNAYIHEHPEYGKIVCRCENVTEGEILYAIRSNPPAMDIDAVKRRTRSGMGRCQGGFCGPYVMELISKELSIPMERVTKSGGNSYMVFGRIGE